ncbi:MAG: GDP-mannose 4,6-dehydratase, partial [Candidatus Methanosuratus sp.]|nr:GDP-mannose 4,6-dehydratase [Candidatus Methanosuratincola sp.]
RDFVFVGDVVEANILAMGAADRVGGEVFNVGTGIETTFNRVVEILAEELNVEVKPVYVENPIKNYVRRTLADTTKAAEKLGFRAKVNLLEGIRKTLEYYRARL